MKDIRFNSKLNKYTMKEEVDGIKNEVKEPPKYSPEDKYAKYRREAKKEEYEKKGFI